MLLKWSILFIFSTTPPQKSFVTLYICLIHCADVQSKKCDASHSISRWIHLNVNLDTAGWLAPVKTLLETIFSIKKSIKPSLTWINFLLFIIYTVKIFVQYFFHIVGLVKCDLVKYSCASSPCPKQVFLCKEM